MVCLQCQWFIYNVNGLFTVPMTQGSKLSQIFHCPGGMSSHEKLLVPRKITSHPFFTDSYFCLNLSDKLITMICLLCHKCLSESVSQTDYHDMPTMSSMLMSTFDHNWLPWYAYYVINAYVYIWSQLITMICLLCHQCSCLHLITTDHHDMPTMSSMLMSTFDHNWLPWYAYYVINAPVYIWSQLITMICLLCHQCSCLHLITTDYHDMPTMSSMLMSTFDHNWLPWYAYYVINAPVYIWSQLITMICLLCHQCSCLHLITTDYHDMPTMSSMLMSTFDHNWLPWYAYYVINAHVYIWSQLITMICLLCHQCSCLHLITTDYHDMPTMSSMLMSTFDHNCQKKPVFDNFTSQMYMLSPFHLFI